MRVLRAPCPCTKGTNAGVAQPLSASPGTITVSVLGLGAVTFTVDVFLAGCDPSRLAASLSNTSTATLMDVLAKSGSTAAGPLATAAVVNATRE